MIGFLKKFRTLDLNNVKRWYFSFEGGLCSGKTTMLKKTKEYLESKNLKVATFENADEDCRKMFRKREKTNDWIDGHLFCADTLDINERIKDLELDIYVLEERSFLSTLIYQKTLPVGIIYNWHRIDLNSYYDSFNFIATSEYFLFPDVVFVLDVSPAESYKRAKNDPNEHKIEKWDSEKDLENIRIRYKDLFNANPFLFDLHFIDEMPLENTWNRIKEFIDFYITKNYAKSKVVSDLKRLGYRK